MDPVRTAKKQRKPSDDKAGEEPQASAHEAALLQLQRVAGNRAANALSAVAPASRNESADVVARQAASEPALDLSGPEGGAVDSDTAQRVASASSGGTALGHDTRTNVEGVIGASLSDVRLHDNSESNALAEKFGAAAFTVGRDIFFGRNAGAPDSPERQHVLAHELGHTVQDSGGAQPLVARRLLTDEAARAFKTTVAANPSFEEARKAVDDNVSASDQKKLSKLHGMMHSSKKETDQDRALADAIRSVVLAEYAQRLVTLKENDKLTDKERSKKRAIYIKKADEFREKVAPLTKKGAAAPETRNFLADFGLDTIAEPTKQQTAKVMSAGPRIDVRSTFIGGAILGVRVRAHLFIVYTTRDGKQIYFRGGPDEDGNTRADWGDYYSDTVDYDPSAPSVTVMEGPAAAGKLDKLIEATNTITGMKVPYQAQISKEYGGDKPNIFQTAATYGSMLTSNEGENCNAAAWTILTRAGVKRDKPFGKHPGWGAILGSHTPGKENASPAPEADDPAKKRKYRFDPDRDEMNKRGMVQIYHDRACQERQDLVAADTDVELLDEARDCRKVLVHGKVGYVARSEKEIGRQSLQRLLTRMTGVKGIDLKGIAKAPADAPHSHTVQLANEWEIEPERLVAAAAMHFKGTGTKVQERLTEKLEMYGHDKLKKILAEPVEVEELSRETGARQDQVLDAIVSFMGKLDLKEKVVMALGTRLEMKQQLYFFASDIPNLTVIREVASECGTDANTVFDFVRELLPPGIEPLGDQVRNMKNPALRKIADGKDPAKAKVMAEKARVPVEFVVKRIGEYVGPAKKKKVVEPPKKAEKKALTEEDKKLKLFIDIPASAMYENAPQWTATGLGQVISVERTDGEWAYIKTSLDYFPVWARADALERFKEAHGQPPPKKEEEAEEPKEQKAVDDPKLLKLFIDMPNSPADYLRPNVVATSPTQIEKVVEDGPHWLAVKTTLDDWPFWVKTADFKLFAAAHNVDFDKKEEAPEKKAPKENAREEEAPKRVIPPSEDVPPLMIYDDPEDGAKKWGEWTDVDELMVVSEKGEWLEVTFKFEGSFVWAKRAELEEWETKHNKKAKRM